MDGTSNKKKTVVVKRYVPPELVEEIFLRLPCRSLDRFKLAAKLMASFLQDVQFINEHRKRNMKPSHYLTWDTSDKTKLHVFRLSRDGYRHVKSIATQKFKVALSSSYGLVCIHGYDSKSVALFNPLSGKLAALPDLPRPFAFETKNTPEARIKTTWRTNYTGFGFDPKSHKYKIVQFTHGLYTYDISRCYVLTVNNDHPTTSSWRKIDISYQSTVDHFYFYWLPIYVDGVLYWEMIGHRDGMPVDVFAFDLSTERISVFETKSRFGKYAKGKHLTVLEGKLCCIVNTPADDMYVMEIWKLSYGVETNVSWILSYKLDIYGNCSKLLYPLYVDDYKGVICESFGDLYRYDLRSKSLEIYPVKEKVEGVAYSPYTIFSNIHSETIVPVALPS